MEPSSDDTNNENSATVSSDKKPEVSETTTNTTTTQASSSSSSAASSSSSSWWNSLIQTAKEKSATAIEIMRSDLAEFKSTMSADTNRLVTTLAHVDVDSTASAATGNLLNSLSSLSNALGINSLISGMTSADDEMTSENEKKQPMSASAVTSPPGNVHDRFKADLKQLQTDEATFLNDVQSAEFEQWMASFNSDEFKSTISDLLIENSAMRLIYSQLVPAQMSNNQFWSRYFFKVNQLEDDYKKRVQLLEKASRTAPIETTSNKESNDWEDDDSPNQSTTAKSEISPKPVEETTAKEEEEEAEKNPVTEEEEKVTKEATQSNSSTTTKPEESDDWEKLSDVDNQVDQSKKKVGKEETEGVEADSSKLSEVEVPRSNNRKETDNDWEDWDE